MSHLDDDTLAAIAIGDSSSASAATHLASCSDCLRRLEGFTELVGALATTPDAATLDAPPPHVWLAISRAIASEGEEQSQPAPLSLDRARQARSRRSAWTIAAVAASGIVVGATGVALLGLIGSREVSATVASAALEDLAAGTAAGTATVEERADGATVLVVDTAYATPAEGSLEVWLIDPNIEGMISVGYLTSDHGEFVLPAEFDIGAHPIVDISVEPHDGVPTHSGVSITRGVLDL